MKRSSSSSARSRASAYGQRKCCFLFCLQRPNVFSYGDLAILRGMRMVYRHKEIDRARFEQYRKRFSPYCSIASLYFWAVSGGVLPELTDPAAPKPKK